MVARRPGCRHHRIGGVPCDLMAQGPLSFKSEIFFSTLSILLMIFGPEPGPDQATSWENLPLAGSPGRGWSKILCIIGTVAW
jgi:hypothetical protein